MTTVLKAWDVLTERLVGASAAPFSIIALPQVIQNFAAMRAGHAAALGIISWEGIVTYTFGNTLMSSHFAARGETSALVVQLVSILNNFLILSQVAYTGYMPSLVFSAVAAAAAFAAAVNVGRAYGWLPKESDGLWRHFQLASGVMGLCIMPQVFYMMLFPRSFSPAPAVVAFLALCVWLYTASRHMPQHSFHGLVDALPGTAATMLFCLAPLPQLVKNFLDPATLGGLSVGSLLLNLFGNGLMYPRALKTQDPIWLIGSVWANIAAWATLLSLYLGHSAATGQSFVSAYVFGAVSVVMVAFFSWATMHDARAKGHPSVVSSLAEIFGGEPEKPAARAAAHA